MLATDFTPAWPARQGLHRFLLLRNLLIDASVGCVGAPPRLVFFTNRVPNQLIGLTIAGEQPQ